MREDVSTVNALVFFRFSGERLVESGSFSAENHMHLKGNHLSKFRLFRISHFEGVSGKQTNKHTHSLYSITVSLDFFQQRKDKTKDKSLNNSLRRKQKTHLSIMTNIS